MADDNEKLKDRIAYAARPFKHDKQIAGQLVTQGQLASLIAVIGGCVTNQRALSHALMQDDKAGAEGAMKELDEGLLDLIRSLRNLVAAPESDT